MGAGWLSFNGLFFAEICVFCNDDLKSVSFGALVGPLLLNDVELAGLVGRQQFVGLVERVLGPLSAINFPEEFDISLLDEVNTVVVLVSFLVDVLVFDEVDFAHIVDQVDQVFFSKRLKQREVVQKGDFQVDFVSVVGSDYLFKLLLAQSHESGPLIADYSGGSKNRCVC